MNLSGPRRSAALPIMLVVCALAACNGADSDRDIDGGGDKQRVEAYLNALLVDRRWADWPQHYAADAMLNGSTLALQIMRGTAEGLHYSFGAIDLEIVDQVAEPGRVATFFVIRGVHERPFNDTPATHEQVALEGFVLDRFSDGVVVESKMFLDVWGLSRQVAAGARPPR